MAGATSSASTSRHGGFGENLTREEPVARRGARSATAAAVGSTVLEVCQPRFPCAKLGLRFGDPLIGQALRPRAPPRRLPAHRRGAASSAPATRSRSSTARATASPSPRSTRRSCTTTRSCREVRAAPELAASLRWHARASRPRSAAARAGRGASAAPSSCAASRRPASRRSAAAATTSTRARSSGRPPGSGKNLALVVDWRSMPTSLVTGGAGFLGSHLCDALLARGHRVICVDNLETGIAQQHRAHPRAGVRAPARRHHRAVLRRRADRLRLPPRLAGVADRLPAHPAAHAEGRLVRHAPHARPGQEAPRALPASPRRSEVYGDPQVHPQPETYWGHVNPIGPRGVYDEAKRYAEALTMAYHRAAGRRHGDHADLQHLRPADAPARRPRDPDVPAPGAAPTGRSRSSATGSQTRSFCYVERPDRGHDPRSPSPATTSRSTSATPNEFTLLELAETVIEVTGSKSEIVYEALPDRRPAGPPARHHASPRSSSAGSPRSSCARACSGRSTSRDGEPRRRAGA